MKNGIHARVDEDLYNLIIDVQKERVESGIDVTKNYNKYVRDKKSITELTRIIWKILKRKDNIDLLLTLKI
jgi:hypothetical protein